jgi:hypothetical protein
VTPRPGALTEPYQESVEMAMPVPRAASHLIQEIVLFRKALSRSATGAWSPGFSKIFPKSKKSLAILLDFS